MAKRGGEEGLLPLYQPPSVHPHDVGLPLLQPKSPSGEQGGGRGREEERNKRIKMRGRGRKKRIITSRSAAMDMFR